MPGPERSLGCYRCRSMKLKCDQEHPACKRCRRVKVDCPGYRHEGNLIFVDVSNQVRERGSSQRPPRSRNITRETVSGRIENFQRERTTSSSSSCSPVSTPLHRIDLDQHALCRFMSEFTMRTDDLRESPGFLHNLPELYREFSDRDPLLENAVMAVALAHHSNQGGSCDAALQARKLYGLSLSLLNEKLSGGNLQSETALIAVLFLNYYLVFGNESPTSDVWSIHSDALSTLIRTRGTSSQFLDPKIGGITRAAVYIAVYRNLTRRILPGAEVALLEKSLELYRDAIWAQTTLALSRITRLLCQCDELLARDSQDVLASEAVVQLIFRMRDEDHRYPEKYDTMALDKTRLERSFFDIIWVNSWRAARITLLQSLIDLIIRADTQSELQFRLTDLERLRYAAEKSILTIVDEITTTTSSLLAEFEAKRLQANRDGTSIGCVAIAYFMSLAPLGVAIGVRGLSEEQRLHIAGQLAAASANIGLRRPIRERWRR